MDFKKGSSIIEEDNNEFAIVYAHKLKKISGTGFYITECNMVIEPYNVRSANIQVNPKCPKCFFSIKIDL